MLQRQHCLAFGLKCLIKTSYIAKGAIAASSPCAVAVGGAVLAISAASTISWVTAKMVFCFIGDTGEIGSRRHNCVTGSPRACGLSSEKAAGRDWGQTTNRRGERLHLFLKNLL